MQFKALKHKTHSDQWGVFMEDGEIAMCSTPYLFPMSSDKNIMDRYWTSKTGPINWGEFELVIVELKIL